MQKGISQEIERHKKRDQRLSGIIFKVYSGRVGKFLMPNNILNRFAGDP